MKPLIDMVLPCSPSPRSWLAFFVVGSAAWHLNAVTVQHPTKSHHSLKVPSQISPRKEATLARQVINPTHDKSHSPRKVAADDSIMLLREKQLRGSECAPNASTFANLDKMLVHDGNNVNLPKFYLHEDNEIGFEGVRKCFEKEFRLDAPSDNFDSRLEIQTAEHMGEWWLFRLLAQHPHRVDKEEQADVHVIGALPFLSYNASTLNGKCGTPADHLRRMKSLKQDMNGIIERNPGTKLFMATTHFLIEDLFGIELLDFMEEHKVIVGTADLDYGGKANEGWKGREGIPKVVIPYKAHGLAEKHNSAEYSPHPPQQVHRDTDFIFRGCLHRGQNSEGSLRTTVKDLEAKLVNNSRNASVEERCIVGKGAEGRWLRAGGDPEMIKRLSSSLAERAKLSDRTINEYVESRFCFVPAGDSPTSRRLFDVLATGCVPVYLGNATEMVLNLPFPRTIDWRNLMLFAGDLQCASEHLHEISQRLVAISDRKPAYGGAAWQAMSHAGKLQFHNFLNYRRRGLGDALLRELQSML